MTITSTIVSCGVIVTSAVFLREPLIDAWYLRQLRRLDARSDPVTVAPVVERLALRRVRAAIPELIRLLEEAHDPEVPQCHLYAYEPECSLARGSRLALLEEWFGSVDHFALIALSRFGEGGARALATAQKGWSPERRHRLAAIIGLAAAPSYDAVSRTPYGSCADVRSLLSVAEALADYHDARNAELARAWTLPQLAAPAPSEVHERPR